MEKWIIENKDWVVPLSVALLSLIGATLGGWWSGRKRIGIEVLSKNRQEWINSLRLKVSELETDCFFLSDLFYEIYLIENDNNKKSAVALLTLHHKIVTNLIFLELLLSSQKKFSILARIFHPIVNRKWIKKRKLSIMKKLIMRKIIAKIFYNRTLRKKSDCLMLQLQALFTQTRRVELKNLTLEYEKIVNNTPYADFQNLPSLRNNFESSINIIHKKVQRLISVEWKRIKKTK